MTKLSVAIFAGLISFLSVPAMANDNEQQCQQLQQQHDIIYAAKGFCFKDPEKQKLFDGKNCHTQKPRFSEKEQQLIDDIKARQKALNCK